MQVLGDWQDASAVILSCAGPLRRHRASMLPVANVALPQVLLGAESQLLAFAALAHQERVFFAPFPEMFHGPESLALALPGIDTSRAVHLRFGGVRAARLLKGARNACVMAERPGPGLLTASHHPFAPGTVLPAAMERVYALHPGIVRPTALGRNAQSGSALPITLLPDGMVDLNPPPAESPKATAGLEVMSLADFRSDIWAAGPAPTQLPPPCPSGCVLLPWNMDHPGSIVPALLERLASLHAPSRLPRVVLLPFNYVGQTGIIRDLVKLVAGATNPAGAALENLFIARLSTLAAVPALHGLARIAWIDGNDPEHWWTIGRLHACGITTLLLDANEAAPELPHPTRRLPSDEALWVEAQTRCGALIFAARLPSLRALPNLLRQTAEFQPPPPAPPPAPGPRPAARPRRRAGAPA